MKKLIRLYDCVPLKTKAIHMFTGPGRSIASLVLPQIKKLYGKNLRLRMFLHAGSGVEIAQKVEEFGLNEAHTSAVYASPTDRERLLREWLADMRREEDEADAPRSQEV